MIRRPNPPRRPPAGAGFIVTVELLLIFTILLIVVLVALAALRNALMSSGPALRRPMIFDSSAPDPLPIGTVVDFDDSETARVLRPDPNNGLSVLLGVRSDRFATHTPVFYAGGGCNGAAYVHAPSSLPVAPDPDVEQRFGFFDELQGAVYAVGAGGPTGPDSPFGPGLLYRNDPAELPGAAQVNSVYVSSWEFADGPTPGPSPPASSVLNPCRDLAGGQRSGLVRAIEVLDPDTAANLLDPFVPPFVAR